MKPSLLISNYRSKRLESLVKDIPAEKLPYSNLPGQRTRSLLRNSLKQISIPITLNKKTYLPEGNNKTPNQDTPSQTSNNHNRSISDQITTGFQRPSIMSPTSSSLRKLIELQGPQKKYIKDRQSGPAPGTYHRDLPIGGVSYIVGRANRVRERNKTTIGPGSYETEKLPSGIEYSFTPRRKPQSKTFNFPGPGKYSPSSLVQGVKFSIAKAQRYKDQKTQSPGPGSYDLSQRVSSRSALTAKSNRPPLSQIIDTPGPGAYHLELKIGGPELSLSHKYHLKSESIEPGPGTYTPTAFSQTSPSWKFGSSKTRLQFNDHSVPEPSWYNNPRRSFNNTFY